MITKEQVLAAQQDWGMSLVAIGNAHQNQQDFQGIANALLDRLYAYAEGPVLFKPTRAAETPFRLTRDAALSYFIGNNPGYKEDRGFALEPWQNVRFENADIIPRERQALAMGTYYFTNMQNEIAGVEYSFGYILDSAGNLKINLHHSSMPYGK